MATSIEGNHSSDAASIIKMCLTDSYTELKKMIDSGEVTKELFTGSIKATCIHDLSVMNQFIDDWNKISRFNDPKCALAQDIVDCGISTLMVICWRSSPRIITLVSDFLATPLSCDDLLAACAGNTPKSVEIVEERLPRGGRSEYLYACVYVAVISHNTPVIEWIHRRFRRLVNPKKVTTIRKNTRSALLCLGTSTWHHAENRHLFEKTDGVIDTIYTVLSNYYLIKLFQALYSHLCVRAS